MLDEPSAALDPRAEYELFMKLKQLKLGMTTLFISHRLVATVNADWIIVLQDGEVIEQGTHSELMRAEGLYANLFNLQRNGKQTCGPCDRSLSNGLVNCLGILRSQLKMNIQIPNQIFELRESLSAGENIGKRD